MGGINLSSVLCLLENNVCLYLLQDGVSFWTH